jgi:hypothetical protein
MLTNLHLSDDYQITDFLGSIGHRISALANEVTACQRAGSD